MQKNNVNIFYAKTINEVLYHLKNIANLSIIAGGTLCKKTHNGSRIKIPSSCVFIGNIEELKEVNRTERFIEFGSAVTFNQILELGSTRIPPLLHKALLQCSSQEIGNLATIGGNICYSENKLSLYSVLLALDASLELKSTTEIQHIDLMKFDGIKTGFFLTKVRIPVLEWRTEMYKRIGSSFYNGASFTFLADSSKGSLLDDLRIAFAGQIAFRSRELENAIIGTRLPLTDKDVQNLLEKASKLYDEEIEKKSVENNMLVKNQFINLLEQALEELTHY